MLKLIKSVSIFITITFLAISCSSSKTEKEPDSKTLKKHTTLSTGEFKTAVKKACENVDSNTIDSRISVNNVQDITEAISKFGTIEDELDGLISRFERIDPAKEFDDEWETIIDDLSHIRDLYPEMSDTFSQIESLLVAGQKYNPNVDMQKLNDKLTQLQDEADDLLTDLTINTEEIKTISKKIDITDCISSS
jgi:hypothetical protein